MSWFSDITDWVEDAAEATAETVDEGSDYFEWVDDIFEGDFDDVGSDYISDIKSLWSDALDGIAGDGTSGSIDNWVSDAWSDTVDDLKDFSSALDNVFDWF